MAKPKPGTPMKTYSMLIAAAFALLLAPAAWAQCAG